jgi:hypothetical protein
VAEFNILGFLNERIGELIREYSAALMNDRSAAGLLDELSRLSVLREELKKIASTEQTPNRRLVMPAAEFTTIEAVYRRIDRLAREAARCAARRSPQTGDHRRHGKARHPDGFGEEEERIQPRPLSEKYLWPGH